MNDVVVKRPVGRPRLNKPRPERGPRGRRPTWLGTAQVQLAGSPTATKLQRSSPRREIIFFMADLDGGTATLDALAEKFGRARVLQLIRNGWLSFVDVGAATNPAVLPQEADA